MIKKLLCFCCLSLALFQCHAFAMLNLELTQGVNQALPIAVVPFRLIGETSVPVNLAQIISNDLKNSGQFNLLDPANITQFPGNVSDVDYPYWQSKNINNLVIGNVEQVGLDQYQAAFSLLNLYQGSALNTALKQDLAQGRDFNPVMINKLYSVKAKDLHRLGNKIADMIYQKLTGIKGIFGTKIAYVVLRMDANQKREYALEIANMDGSDPQAVLISQEPIMSPSWSPDGKKIAYVSFEHRQAAIFETDLATGKRTLLSRQSGINGAPAFSPNGRLLALVLSHKDTANIYLLSFKSHQLLQLTHGFATYTEPVFSPDGKFLLYTSTQSGGLQLYEMNLQTLKSQRLTFDGNYNATGSFTPDGQNILFLHRRNGHFCVAKMNLKTGNMQVLTHSGDAQSPSVSPNGQMILYSKNYGQSGVLGLVSIDGKVHLDLPESNGIVSEPAWGPF